jgi:hypothetical protein
MPAKAAVIHRAALLVPSAANRASSIKLSAESSAAADGSGVESVTDRNVDRIGNRRAHLEERKDASVVWSPDHRAYLRPLRQASRVQLQGVDQGLERVQLDYAQEEFSLLTRRRCDRRPIGVGRWLPNLNGNEDTRAGRPINAQVKRLHAQTSDWTRAG